MYIANEYIKGSVTPGNVGETGSPYRDSNYPSNIYYPNVILKGWASDCSRIFCCANVMSYYYDVNGMIERFWDLKKKKKKKKFMNHYRPEDEFHLSPKHHYYVSAKAPDHSYVVSDFTPEEVMFVSEPIS